MKVYTFRSLANAEVIMSTENLSVFYSTHVEEPGIHQHKMNTAQTSFWIEPCICNDIEHPKVTLTILHSEWPKLN